MAAGVSIFRNVAEYGRAAECWSGAGRRRAESHTERPCGLFRSGCTRNTREGVEAHRGSVWHAHGARAPDVGHPFVLRRADDATAVAKPSSVRRAFGRPGVSRRGCRCAQAARACEINAYTVFALLQFVVISNRAGVRMEPGQPRKKPGKSPVEAVTIGPE